MLQQAAKMLRNGLEFRGLSHVSDGVDAAGARSAGLKIARVNVFEAQSVSSWRSFGFPCRHPPLVVRMGPLDAPAPKASSLRFNASFT
jgi:hypothetical protein